MTAHDDLNLPRDPGPVPASLRDAFVWARDAERVSSPATMPDDAAQDQLAVFEGEASDPELEAVDRLLNSQEGAVMLGHLVAARGSTAATPAQLRVAAPGRRGFTRDTRAVGSVTRTVNGLKPILLAASLMLVASTSWYVLTLPSGNTAVRSAGDVVELEQTPVSTARAPITLRWRTFQKDARYRVEVLDTDDSPVFSSETSLTSTQLPARALKPGTYRWYVRARATDGTEIRSRVASFDVM
jgi:hypothetical protein